MNIIKHAEFFDPTALKKSIHIIGVGAIGSTVAENLTRLGCTHIHLYDFDTVNDHNIANQMFRYKDIGLNKCVAMKAQMLEINPQISVTTHEKGYLIEEPHAPLTGYVFLCVDSIELRRAIVEENQYNPMIIAMFDFRMRMLDAQHYAALWSKPKHITNLLKTMQFTDAEADATTPVSVCGTSLNVSPTVRSIVAYGIANFIKTTRLPEDLVTMCLSDPFAGTLDMFSAKA